MKLKKILAGLLAVVMVVSLLPAMLFAVSAEDPIKLPVSGYVYSPLNANQPVENAFDTDESTFAEPYGKK